MTSPAASLATLRRRVAALESRVSEVEEGYGETLYVLHRHAVRTDLTLARIADHLGVQGPTDAEVDAAIEAAED